MNGFKVETGINFDIFLKGEECGDCKVLISFTDPFSVMAESKHLKSCPCPYHSDVCSIKVNSVISPRLVNVVL